MARPEPATGPVVRVVRSDESYVGAQGLDYEAGVYAENTGAQHLCMHRITIPPGGRAEAHLHEQHESAVYVISGRAVVLSGEGLRQRDEVGPGDFMYIPANVPHLPMNASDTDPAVAILARTDPNEQESVVLLPDLDALVDDADPASPH